MLAMNLLNEPIELPENIHDLIDLSKEQLEKMLETDDTDQPLLGKEEVDDVMEEIELSSSENEDTDEEIEKKRKTTLKKTDSHQKSKSPDTRR
uniref:Uncharacterized protein n=1 Tax=Moniliophthora roreri TaxID=221103 RepID=A0A0W0FU59_MONRR